VQQVLPLPQVSQAVHELLQLPQLKPGSPVAVARLRKGLPVMVCPGVVLISPG